METKRFISIFIIICMLLSTSIVSSFANENEPMMEIENLVELFEDFSLGDTLRTLKSTTGYKDVYHVVTSGDSVKLTIDPLGTKIRKVLHGCDKKYSLKYQWYTCNAYKKNAHKIDGATCKTLNTIPFSSTGLQYYYCLIRVYEKQCLGKEFVKAFKKPMFRLVYPIRISTMLQIIMMQYSNIYSKSYKV